MSVPLSTSDISSLTYSLTHWGRVTHTCVSTLTIIGSDNGLSLGRRQAIIRTNDVILLIGPLRTNFSEILIENYTFSFWKCIWKCRLENGDHFVSAKCVNSLTYATDHYFYLLVWQHIYSSLSMFAWMSCFCLKTPLILTPPPPPPPPRMHIMLYSIYHPVKSQFCTQKLPISTVLWNPWYLVVPAVFNDFIYYRRFQIRFHRSDYWNQNPILLTWINLNPDMDK